MSFTLSTFFVPWLLLMTVSVILILGGLLQAALVDPWSPDMLINKVTPARMHSIPVILYIESLFKRRVYLYI